MPKIFQSVLIVVSFFLAGCVSPVTSSSAQVATTAESGGGASQSSGPGINGEGYSGTGDQRDAVEARRQDLVLALRMIVNGRETWALGDETSCKVDKQDICPRLAKIAADPARKAFVIAFIKRIAADLLATASTNKILLSDGLAHPIDGESSGWTIAGAGNPIILYAGAIFATRAMLVQAHEFMHVTSIDGKYYLDAEKVGDGAWAAKDVFTDAGAMLTDYFDKESGAFGALDATFYRANVSLRPAGAQNEHGNYARGMTVQSDGKVVVVGPDFTSGDPNWKWAISRFNADGTGDPTFGNGGLTTRFFGGYGELTSVTSDAQGRLVVSGASCGGTTGCHFTVGRFTRDGIVDTTFGTNGYARTTRNGFDGHAQRVAVQADGKIVAGGIVTKDGGVTYEYAIGRFNDDGSVDTTFAPAGLIINTNTSFSDPKAVDFTISPDGSLLLSGLVTQTNSAKMFVASYNQAGQLKWINSIPVATNGEEIYYRTAFLATLSDGRIVTLAPEFDGVKYVGSLGRFTADGKVDTTFGVGGKLTFCAKSGDACFGTSRTVVPTKIAVASGDRLIITAQVSVPGTRMDFGIAILNSNGTVLKGFGENGTVLRNVGDIKGWGTTKSASPISYVQSDGRILIAGASLAAAIPDLALLRLYGTREDLIASLGK